MNSETGLNCFVKEDYQAFFFRRHKTKLHDSTHAGRKKGAKRQASKSTGQSSLNNFLHHWMCKLEGYKCSLSVRSKRTHKTQEDEELLQII
jgi:hypothetical protein